MTGKFMITLRYLREIGACAEGRSEFEKHFPEGGEYQEVLDKCAEEGRMDFAIWLLHKVGPTDDVRTYEDQVNDVNMSICFAGTLVFEKGAIAKSIKAGCGIEAGWGIKAVCGIKAGEGIKAGCGIEAGEGIKAGWGIEAGCEYGIFAGIRIKIKDWSCFAKVSAQSKPKNLISGHWEEQSDTRDSDQD